MNNTTLQRRRLLTVLLLVAAATARADTADLSFLLPSDMPDVEITSFVGRAQRYFEEADINITALAGHPDRSDDAIAALLQQYRQQLLRGRMELARARAVRQPVQPALVLLERFTAAHLTTLQALLPQLSRASQSSVRHTLHLVVQYHQSAQANLAQRSTPPSVPERKRRPVSVPRQEGMIAGDGRRNR